MIAKKVRTQGADLLYFFFSPITPRRVLNIPIDGPSYARLPGTRPGDGFRPELFSPLMRSVHMNTKAFLPGLGGALLIGCVVACSDSTSPGSATTAFDAQVTSDIAPTVGQDVASSTLFYENTSNSSFSGTFSMTSFGDTPPTTGAVGASVVKWIDRNHCGPIGLSLLRFGCRLPWWLGRDTVTYQVFKTDTTTDSVEFAINDTAALSYMFNSRSFADTTGRHENATLILQNGDTVHVWNGVGNGSIKTVRTGPNLSQTYTLASTDTTIGLTFYVTHNGHHRYPMAGTIIRNYTVTRLRQGSDTTQRTTTRRVVVTFDSTATPTMTINGNTTFTLNLASPQAVVQH